MDIGKSLTSTLDLREVLHLIMHRIGQLFPVTHCAILLLEDSNDHLYYEIASGVHSEKVKNIRYARGEGLAGRSLLHGEVVEVDDLEKDTSSGAELLSANIKGARAALYIPVKFKNRVIGILELVDDEPGAIATGEKRHVVNSISNFVAVAADSARSYSRIQHLVIVDELTGLYNAAYLLDFLDYEMERAKRYKAELSVVFFDMDYFKKVNDTYGHLVGSRLLTEIGQLVKLGVRKADVATRYGGDEFVLVLPNTPKEGAIIVAQNIRTAINNQTFLTEQGHKIKISASFGLASFPNDGDSKLKVLQLADKAMYKAKEEGRDRVCTA